MKEKEKNENGPGLTIKRTNISKAFSLITFMVGELIFIENSLLPPVDLSNYIGLNSETFEKARQRVLKIIETEEEVQLNMEESLHLYMLVDIVCRCMVNDSNEMLKDLALQNLEIENNDYDKVRLSYLKYAESLVQKMNKEFQGVKEFNDMISNLNA